ncbi:hypothetical protein D3C71_1605600 [compost metagenome]
MQQYLLHGLAVQRHGLRNGSDQFGVKPTLLPYALKVIASNEHRQQVAEVDDSMLRLETSRKFNVVQNSGRSDAADILPFAKGLSANSRAIGKGFSLVPNRLEIAYPLATTLK